jgi:small subunit ribosomal protein S1
MADDKDSFAALFEGAGPDAARRSKGGARLRSGERLDVKVVAIGKSAVFADLGERGGKLEGFFERADLCDRSGTLRVEVGSSVSAVVQRVDDGAGQVRLSPLFVRGSRDGEPLEDETGAEVRIPVARAGPLLVEGAHVRGSVAGVERYGVFVQIEGAQGRAGRGLVPAAETGAPRGADLRRLFPIGSPTEAKVIAIADDGKIRLSIRALAEDGERANFEAYTSAARADASGRPETAGAEPARGGGPKKPAEKPIKSFGTLGDLLGGAGRTPKPPATEATPRKRR